jgi:hypothetical protein
MENDNSGIKKKKKVFLLMLLKKQVMVHIHLLFYSQAVESA